MDSIGVNYIRKVIQQQLEIAEESKNSDAIMCVKVIQDEFERTFSYLE